MRPLIYLLSILAILLGLAAILLPNKEKQQLAKQTPIESTAAPNLPPPQAESIREEVPVTSTSPDRKNNYLTESWDDVYRRYKASLDQDARLHLTSKLASMAQNSNGIDINPLALSKLLDIATNDDDDEVRSYAVMNYARIADAESALKLLRSARENGTMDHESYHSELARVYLRSEFPESEGISIIDEIASSKDTYTAEVIFSTIPYTELSHLSASEKEKLGAYLDNNQPAFSSVFSSMGITDALFYKDWILSTAILATGQHGPEKIVTYLLNRFKNGFPDAREAVSLAMTDPFRQLERSEDVTALRKLIWDETLLYAESYPDNAVIQTLGISPELESLHQR